MSNFWPVQVSIIMPCFNGEGYIEQAINSVIEQTFHDWELLVVDNNSTDSSLSLIQKFASKDGRIISLSCSSPGAANARNLAIRVARGRYIAFLDCDDVWLPEKLQRQIQEMRLYDAVFSWTSYCVVNPEGRRIRDQRASRSIDYRSFLAKRSVIGCLTAVYDTKRLGKMFMPNIKMRQDFALWAKIIHVAEERGWPMIGLNDVLAMYRVHENSLTKNKMRAAYYQWLFYRKIERLSFSESARYFVSYMINGIKERLRNCPPDRVA